MIFGFLAGIAVILVLISSKFASQVLLFQIPLCIYLTFVDALSIISMLSAIVIALFFFRNVVNNIVSTHYLHSRNYRSLVTNVHSVLLKMTSTEDLKKVLNEFEIKKFLKATNASNDL